MEVESSQYGDFMSVLNPPNPRQAENFRGGGGDSDGKVFGGTTTNSNSIQMDHVCCLVCCKEVGNKEGGDVNNLIKQEVVDLDGGGFEVADVNPPLLVVEGVEEKQNVVQCFHKLFKIKQSEKDLWSGGGSEVDNQIPFPFCGGCSSQLIMLFKLKKKVEELEKAIVNKMDESEDQFEKGNLYKKDKRCYKIRKRILNGKKSEKPNERVVTKPKVKKGKKTGRGRPRKDEKAPTMVAKLSTVKIEPSSNTTSTSRRISNRSSKPISRLGVDGSGQKREDGDPIVVLSKEDKYRAERYQDSFVKVEPEPLNVLDDDDDDQEDDFSSFDPLYIPPSPAHSWSQNEDEEPEEEEEDSSGEEESDSWIPPIHSDSINSTPNKRRIRRKRRSAAEGSDEDIEDGSKTDEGSEYKSDSAGDQPPLIIKRKPGRPPKPREPELPGPKLKFKKSATTKVDRRTGTITFLKVPLTRMEGGLQYKCTLCNEILPNEKRFMSKHVIREHTDRYVCNICGKKLSSTPMLRTHLRAHTGAGPKKIGECEVCLKPYARQYLLDVHKWTHYNEEERNEAIARGDKLPPEYEKKFQCDKCAKRFGTNNLLQKHHIVNHQAEEERPKELCPMCGVAVHHLRGHIARVHEETPEDKKFSCTECDKKFTRHIRLMRHKRMVHCGIRDFKCTMCPREFATNKQLKEHTFVHMNIRKFQCEFCASAFVKKHHLQRHTKVYHDHGSAPRRPAFIRGPEKKTMEQRNCFKNQGSAGGGGGAGQSSNNTYKQEF